MNSNLLLLLMICFYLIPIFYVYINYKFNKTLSSIICNNNCKNYVLFFMSLMSITTILYEYERNDICSLIMLFILFIFTFTLIYIDETYIIHYISAFLVFIIILFFMTRHCYLQNNIILLLLLILEIILFILIIINIKTNIFYIEIAYLVIFAVYYLYLHYICFIC